MHTLRNMAGTFLLLILVAFASGCSTLSAPKQELPPVLSQEELIRPYDTLGRIQVTREVYFIGQTTTASDLRAWGYQVIREEASKMNADAVIMPEISGQTTPVTIPSVQPATVYRAAGVAIKFK